MNERVLSVIILSGVLLLCPARAHAKAKGAGARVGTHARQPCSPDSDTASFTTIVETAAEVQRINGNVIAPAANQLTRNNLTATAAVTAHTSAATAPVASSASTITSPVAGFPLNNSDAYVGPRGLTSVSAVTTISRSPGVRQLSGPMTSVTYNPADNVQIGAIMGGVLVSHAQDASVTAAGDVAVAGKYTFYEDNKRGLAAAVSAQVTSNVGHRAVDAGLTSQGPSVTVAGYVSKTLGDRDTVSLNLARTYGPHGTGEWDYGPVLAHQINDKWTGFTELDGQRDVSTGDKALSAAIGLAYQVNQHYTLGVGVSQTVGTQGLTYSRQKSLMLGVSWVN